MDLLFSENAQLHFTTRDFFKKGNYSVIPQVSHINDRLQFVGGGILSRATWFTDCVTT